VHESIQEGPNGDPRSVGLFDFNNTNFRLPTAHELLLCEAAWESALNKKRMQEKPTKLKQSIFFFIYIIFYGEK
jgi:hypothetical protein